MQITNQALDWSSDDEDNLRAFLMTETGKRFLPKLLEGAPTNLTEGDTNKILIRSGIVLGWQKVVQTALSLAFRPPVSTVELNQPEAYPPLDKDEAWNDGNKLN